MEGVAGDEKKPASRADGGLRSQERSQEEQRRDIAAFINTVNRAFTRHHLAFERSFWDNHMALTVDSTAEALERNKEALDTFLNDTSILENCQALLATDLPTPEQRAILKIIEKTWTVSRLGSAAAVCIRNSITKREAALERKRNTMPLGYNDPNDGGKFVPASSVVLATTINTSADEATRRACYDGMCTIGPYIVADFVDIVKRRNALARLQGFVDFYDYTVTKAEGFSKADLFKILDDLERKTAPLLAQCLARIRAEHGDAALQPWNFAHAIAGSLTEELDPYFPFTRAVDVWTETFARMGIDYNGATIKADLCDRPNKYSNGFCHWPANAYVDPTTGETVPSVAGLTSVAVPNQVGSGRRGIAVLLHEGGHAAHMANNAQGSPLFSQERPPSSVPYAETQSMFLESVMSDAAWLGRYAVSEDGTVIPWELVKRMIRMEHPVRVLGIRSMLAVAYFEKALYEMADADLTPDNVVALADRIEIEIMGRRTARPLLAVPHVLSDESSCYYHGYMLADMAVHQTRRHFLDTYKEIVDNPRIGKDLCDGYWKPGNSITFLQAVENVTGAPLTADAIVDYVGADLDTFLNDENTAYLRAVAQRSRSAVTPFDVNKLNLTLHLVHGDETIVATTNIAAAVVAYAKWVAATFPPRK